MTLFTLFFVIHCVSSVNRKLKSSVKIIIICSNICARGKHNSTAFILSCARTFLVTYNFTTDGCLRNNSDYTCTWSATLVMRLPSPWRPWWEWSTSCCHQLSLNPIQWKFLALGCRYKSADTHSNIGLDDTSSGWQQKWEHLHRNMHQSGSKIRS